jgi:hypothetical protein
MPDLGLLFGRGEHAPYFGSVLPRIAATPGSEGTRLTVAGAGSRDVWRLVYYAAMAVLAVSIPVLRHKIAQGTRAFVLGFTIAMMFTAALHEYLRWHRLRRATLVVRPWPIKFGSPVEARFRIFMRDAAPVSALAAKVECTEEVVIGIGQDAKHRRSTRYQADLDCVHQSDRRRITAAWTFIVPEEYPQSLAVPSNKVTWRLTVTVTTDAVKIPVAFDLLVVPEVAG